MLFIEVTAAVDAAGTQQSFYFATAGDNHKGKTTEATDTPANTFFKDKLLDPGTIGINAYSNGRTGGFTKLDTGQIDLNNINGTFDIWRTYNFASLPVVIRSGSQTAAYPAGVTTLLNGTADAIETTFKRTTIRLRDKQYIFQVPLLTTQYAGTNVLPAGLEGTASDIKGKVKPRVYGSVKNILPPCVNTSLLTYQVSDGAVSDISAVYDKGVLITKGADYANSTLLQAAAPGAGTYITCFAEGYFRLGTSPTGQVTADVLQGANAAARTTAQIMKAICLAAGLSAGSISVADVTALDTANSSVIGVWIDSAGSVQSILDTVAASVGGWYGFDSTGVLRMGQLTAPSGTPLFSLYEYNILQGIELKPAKDTGMPVWRATVNYNKMWQVQNDSDFAGAVATARRALLKEEFRSEPSSDVSIKTQWTLADEYTVDTLLTVQADAAAEAARLLALFKVRRDVFEIPIALSIFTQYNPTIMSVISVQHPRFEMSAGKLFRLLGYRIELANNRVVLTLWG